MPWVAGAAHAGFSSATPWLPLGQGHAERAVDVQEADPNSMLHFTRQLLAVRRGQPALRRGSVQVETLGDVLLVHRDWQGQRVTGAFNLGAQAATIALAGQLLAAHGGASATHLPAFSGVLLQCA
jgi:alpha-glucosidase